MKKILLDVSKNTDNTTLHKVLKEVVYHLYGDLDISNTPPPFKKRWGEMGGEEKRARAWGTVFNELLQYLKKAQGLHQNKHK